MRLRHTWEAMQRKASGDKTVLNGSIFKTLFPTQLCLTGWPKRWAVPRPVGRDSPPAGELWCLGALGKKALNIFHLCLEEIYWAGCS